MSEKLRIKRIMLKGTDVVNMVDAVFFGDEDDPGWVEMYADAKGQTADAARDTVTTFDKLLRTTIETQPYTTDGDRGARHRLAAWQDAPATLSPAVPAATPGRPEAQNAPSRSPTAREFRGFDYILVGDNILIVDPVTLEIVAVIPA